MRRQYSGEVKYCWPASCWRGVTSHRRNSAFSRPSRLARHAAGHQRLRVDGLPVLELRRDVDVDRLSMIGGLVDRREQPAALEVVGDDLRHADADLVVGRRARDEIRDRDRQRREVAFGDWRCASAPGAAQRERRSRAQRRQSGNDCRRQAKQHMSRSLSLSVIGHFGSVYKAFTANALKPVFRSETA